MLSRGCSCDGSVDLVRYQWLRGSEWNLARMPPLRWGLEWGWGPRWGCGDPAGGGDWVDKLQPLSCNFRDCVVVTCVWLPQRHRVELAIHLHSWDAAFFSEAATNLWAIPSNYTRAL